MGLQGFENKRLRLISWFVSQSNTLLLADVFGNVRNTFLEIYEIDHVRFHTASWLAYQAVFKTPK